MKIKFKKLDAKATIPSYSKNGDAGLDITCIGIDYLPTVYYCMYHEYSTGIAVKIPEGYVGLLFPRSSISNTSLILANSVGVIDSGYTGEIKFRFKNIGGPGGVYGIGDRIGQLIILPIPHIELEEVEELMATERGSGGFGSTGN